MANNSGNCLRFFFIADLVKVTKFQAQNIIYSLKKINIYLGAHSSSPTYSVVVHSVIVILFLPVEAGSVKYTVITPFLFSKLDY